MSKSTVLIFCALSTISLIFSCKKESTTIPEPVTIADTVGASQFVMCKIDTINYISATTSGSTDTISVPSNNLDLTKIFTSHKALQNGQQLTRNLTLTLSNFKTKQVATYQGGMMFAIGRTDVLINGNAVDEQHWTIFGSSNNKITVTSANDSLVRGTFNFKLQNNKNKEKFIEVTKGIFKVRLK